MSQQQRWYAGGDWVSENHHVLITDGEGHKLDEKVFRNGSKGLAEMAARVWLKWPPG